MRSSMIRRLVFLPALAALALGGAACDGGDTTTPTTPTTPTVNTTETFNGSIGINGATSFTFPISVAGTVTASLRTLTPSDIQVSLALGTWNGVSCAVVLTNDRAGQGSGVTGSVSGAGTLCVRIADIGQNTGQTVFEVVVVHP